jgi:hypothetical protein
MSKWEYRVVFAEGWERVSIEGHETRPEHGERRSGFGRRMLNSLGADGWELSGVQHVMPGRSYMIFKRPLAEGAEPDMSVARREHQPQGEASEPDSGAQAVSM